MYCGCVWQVVPALDMDFVAGIHCRMPTVVVSDTTESPACPNVASLEACNDIVSVDHSPLMAKSGQFTAAVLRGFASSGAALSALFPTSAVRDARRLLPAACPYLQSNTIPGRAVDAAVVLLAQLIPFLPVDQAEV